jgi:hypothetical protein
MDHAPPARGKTMRVPGIQLEFELPSAEWRQTDAPGEDGVGLYGYKREPILNPQRLPIIPFIGFIIHRVGPNSGDLLDFYTLIMPTLGPMRIENGGFMPLGVGQLHNGMLIKAHHSIDGPDHSVRLVLWLREELGVVIICDTTSDVLEQVEPEFQATLATLREY